MVRDQSDPRAVIADLRARLAAVEALFAHYDDPEQNVIVYVADVLAAARGEGDRPAEPWPDCPAHREVQHRDGQPPWCKACGWARGEGEK